ncbi:hypothetical protein [Streptomyces hypolithicus]
MTTRLTWVQPEDLLAHELRQAAEDGRDPTPLRVRWESAGGTSTPPPSGSSPTPAAPHLRTLAETLLTELAHLPTPSAQYEPTPLTAIREACPTWPPPTSAPTSDRASAPASPVTLPGGDASGRSPQGVERNPPEEPHLPERSAPEETPRRGTDPSTPGSGTPGRSTPAPCIPAPLLNRLHAAWLGRAAGCLLGKPVEKLPLDAIRQLAASTGNWPLRTWFTARGVPEALLARHPWNRRSAPTSLAENINGMPEDDDLNYPLLGLLLLQRHTKAFTTTHLGAWVSNRQPAFGS